MKKTSLLKVFLSLVLSVMIIFIATSVNAEDGFNDITEQLLSGNSSSSSTNTDNSSSTNSTNTTNTTNTNSSSLNNITNTNTSSNNTNNSSVYNSTSLPDTGIGDTLPIAALVLIFGISAVYAYKKIKDYKNI